MRERIFSIESEYGVSFIPVPGSNDPTKETIVGALRTALTDVVGLPESLYFANGSKFYHDVGHAEWAQPECRSARELACYDKAADVLMARVTPRAQEILAADGFRGQILVVKNNVDVHGNTYGCHENYMAERETVWLDHEDYLRLSIRYLLPFLATRLIMCSPGRVGLGRKGEQGFAFQIGQRADFINCNVSRDTRDSRGLFNLGRENESFSEGAYRRLHLILGDACMSGWGTLIKLGTFGLLLRMLEDMEIGDIPHLQDPIKAHHAVSRNYQTLIPLYDGREVTAMNIQRMYLEQAQRYLERYPTSDEEREIVRYWVEVLDALERDPSRVYGKVDWITKKTVLDRFLATSGITWEQASKRPERYKLQELDIQFHNIDPNAGLYYRLIRAKNDPSLLDTLWDVESINCACTTPPPYTRARVRGEAIASARRTHARVEVKNWNEVKLGAHRVELHDPFAYFSPDTYTLLNTGKLNP